MICEKYSSRVCIILVLEKTKCLVRQVKTVMPRLTNVTNHSELCSEVLNSFNKNAPNEMSECLHDKVRKHATKQVKRNHSVFPRSSANFIISSLARVDIQESDVKFKGTAANCVAIAIASAVIVRFRNTKALAFYRTVETHG